MDTREILLTKLNDLLLCAYDIPNILKRQKIQKDIIKLMNKIIKIQIN